MADTLRTKTELLALFADNATHDITPQDLRDFVVSNQAEAQQIETTPGVNVSEFSDQFVADVGASSATLPQTAAYGERTLSVINASGGLFTLSADAGETIDGGASISIDDEQFALLQPDAATNNWIVLVKTEAADEPSQYAQATITAGVAITNIVSATFVDINDSLAAGPNSSEFTVGAAEITYTGNLQKRFAVDAAISAGKTMGSIENYTYDLAVNGAPVGAEMGISLTNGVFDIATLFSIFSLSTNDTVKVQVQGDTTSDDIIVGDLVLRLVEIQ